MWVRVPPRVLMKYTKEMLEMAVSQSFSIAETMRNLGVVYVSGGMHTHLKKRLKYFGIDTGHFVRQNKGRKVTSKKEIADWFLQLKGQYKTKSTHLRAVMLSAGFSYACAKCGISEWLGNELRLQIEHKNGDPMDNRRENLEFLCPNCHSQTITHSRSKNNR